MKQAKTHEDAYRIPVQRKPLLHQGGKEMAKRNITVRVFGDPTGITSAMDDARIDCVKRELEKFPAQDRGKIMDMVTTRYKALN